VDGRSTWIRRARDLIDLHLSDLGGSENVNQAEKSLIRRAAVMTVELEMLEHKFATAGQATANDLDLYTRASGNLRRMLEAIGLGRRPKPVEDLQSYLRDNYGRPHEANEEISAFRSAAHAAPTDRPTAALQRARY
jgi:hypothetical protein